MLELTLDIGTVKGGFKVNMIPDHCVLEADSRLPVGLKSEEVTDFIHGTLEGYPGAKVELQEAASNPAAECSHDHAMVGILAKNAERVTGMKLLVIPSIGATDSEFWRYKGVPTYVFGVCPEAMAGINESVSVE